MDEFMVEFQKWFEDFPAEEIKEFKNTPASELVRFHFGLGMELRNQFLWRRTPDELQKIAEELRAAGFVGQNEMFLHPDDISMAIIRMLHDRIQ